MISAAEARNNTKKIDYSWAMEYFEKHIKSAMDSGKHEVDFRVGPMYCDCNGYLEKTVCSDCEAELHRLGYGTRHWTDYCASNGKPRWHFTITW